MSPRPRVLVTVGMGPWPFDRLVGALAPLCGDYEVFAQVGTSSVVPPCEHAAFVSVDELHRRIAGADVVITHAGNTVRMVQRIGKVPIAVAREEAHGEMANDHQVHYLRREQVDGRVRAVWDVSLLGDVVGTHAAEEQRLLRERSLPEAADPAEVAALLDATLDEIAPIHSAPTPGWSRAGIDPAGPRGPAPENPFARHPLRRYAFAWEQLAAIEGPHLDIGAGLGDFAAPFSTSAGRDVHAVDAHPGYVTELRRSHPELEPRLVTARQPLPYPSGRFASASLLDVLEHAADEKALLAETHRVLVPGGTVVVTVPHRHVFSVLDPDNAKYRWPRLHRRVYTARYGPATYQERFGDTSDGMRGDMAADRDEHTNYRTPVLLRLLGDAGFEPELVAGSNLFWRWFQIPYLLGGPRMRRVASAAIVLDGRVVMSPRIAANLFVVARRRP